MQRVNFIPLFILLLFSFSCMPYKIATKEFQERDPSGEPLKQTTIRKEALNHWLYEVVPRHRSQVRWFDIGHWIGWSLLGNDDDGIFGEEESAKNDTTKPIGLSRALSWGIRNPLHNFTFYTIGTAYMENSSFTLFDFSEEKFLILTPSSNNKKNFGGETTSLFIALHGWKPYFALRLYYGRLFEFYLGWRERGNFGIKFLPFKKIEKENLSREIK